MSSIDLSDFEMNNTEAIICHRLNGVLQTHFSTVIDETGENHGISSVKIVNSEESETDIGAVNLKVIFGTHNHSDADAMLKHLGKNPVNNLSVAIRITEAKRTERLARPDCQQGNIRKYSPLSCDA